MLMTLNVFQKFKINALCFVVCDQHLFKHVSKNILLHQVMNSDDKRLQILKLLHEKSDYKSRESIYH